MANFLVRNQSCITNHSAVKMVQSRDDYEDDEPVILLSSRGDKGKALHYRSQRALKLHQNIKEKNWDAVLQLLHYRETDSRIWIEELNEDGSRRWKSLPIHLVSDDFRKW